MARQRRHLVIGDLIAANTYRNQDELRLALAERGVEVTQATLSRDLRSMGIVKTRSGYKMPGDALGPQSSQTGGLRADLIADLVLEVRVAGQMVVLKTGPGRAQAVAYEIDLNPGPGVAGTVAGDDTVFICTPGPRAAERLGASLRGLLGLNGTANGRAMERSA